MKSDQRKRWHHYQCTFFLFAGTSGLSLVSDTLLVFSVWWNMIMLGHEQDLSWEVYFSGTIITHIVIMQLLLLQNIIHGKRFSRPVRFWVYKKILWAYHHLWQRFSKYANLISHCLLYLSWSLQVSTSPAWGWLYLSGYIIACWSLRWNKNCHAKITRWQSLRWHI